MAAGVRPLVEDDANRRHVGARGNDVVGHPVVLHAPVFPDHVLEERPAYPLRDAALDLARGEYGVDDLADLLHRPEVFDARLERLIRVAKMFGALPAELIAPGRERIQAVRAHRIGRR